MSTRYKLLILGLAYLAIFNLGMPDAAFGVAWPMIREDMNLPLERAGIVFAITALLYALMSSQLGRFSRMLPLEAIHAIGAAFIATGLLGFVLAPSFLFVALAAAFVGVGVGLVDSSVNAYMVRSFSARHINWLHCFWGMGAAVSPIIMTQMISRSGFRAGYAVLFVIAGFVAVVTFISFASGLWKNSEILTSAQGTDTAEHFLTKKRHQVLQVAIFFFYGGIEYSSGFWITSVLLEARGLPLELVGMYPSVYFASIMVGRILFGYLAVKLHDMSMIRIGFGIATAGVLVLFSTGHILGMALAGIGLAPVFPSLMHHTGNRFGADTFTKLVGYEFAALGIGVAVLSSMIGQILAHVSLLALFPSLLVLIVICFALNESLERALSKTIGK